MGVLLATIGVIREEGKVFSFCLGESGRGEDFWGSEKPQQHPVVPVEENLSNGVGMGQ